MQVVSGGDIIKNYSGTDRTFERAIQARGPTARVERLARVVTWRDPPAVVARARLANFEHCYHITVGEPIDPVAPRMGTGVKK